MNHLTHPEAPAIGGFGKVPRESACCAAVHIATKLKLQSECFIFFLHVFPHENMEFSPPPDPPCQGAKGSPEPRPWV